MNETKDVAKNVNLEKVFIERVEQSNIFTNNDINIIMNNINLCKKLYCFGMLDEKS